MQTQTVVQTRIASWPVALLFLSLLFQARAAQEQIRTYANSLPAECDPIRRKLYRSFTHNPGPDERRQGTQELEAKLHGFKYLGNPLPATLSLSETKPVVDYFKQFPGLDAGARFNNAGFWELPIPVTHDITVYPND